MRVLLDECVHAGLKRELSGHQVNTVPEMQWRGITNGRLLQRAATEFDVFLTTDKNLEFQQNLATLPLAVIAVQAPSLLWEDVSPFIPAIRNLLAHPIEKKLYRLEGPG